MDNLKDSDYEFTIRYHKYLCAGLIDIVLELLKTASYEETYVFLIYYFEETSIPKNHKLEHVLNFDKHASERRKDFRLAEHIYNNIIAKINESKR